MALPDPRVFPTFARFSRVEATLVRPMVRTVLRSGDAQRADVAPSRWRFSWTTQHPLRCNFHDGWMAFLDSLRGGMKPFYGYDHLRARPIAHPNGIAGWGGSATVAARSAYSITFSGVPNALRLNPGDMLHLAKGVSGIMRVGLHRVTEAAAASGGSIVAAVEPAVLTDIFTVNTAATFYDPRGLFLLDPDSIESGKARDFPPISFSALQVL